VNELDLEEIMSKALSFTISEKRELETSVLYVSNLHITPETILKQIKTKKEYEIKSFSSGMGKIIEKEAIRLITIFLRKYSSLSNPIRYKDQFPVRLTDLETGIVVSGYIDLLVYFGVNSIPVEIKSVTQNEFNSYNIKNRHLVQLLTYMCALNSPYGYLLEINRNTGEFKIEKVFNNREIYSCVLKRKALIEDHLSAYLVKFKALLEKELKK